MRGKGFFTGEVILSNIAVNNRYNHKSPLFVELAKSILVCQIAANGSYATFGPDRTEFLRCLKITIPALYRHILSISEKNSDRKTEGQPLYIVVGISASFSGDSFVFLTGKLAFLDTDLFRRILVGLELHIDQFSSENINRPVLKINPIVILKSIKLHLN
jgi:hypothetical protein